MDGSHVELTDIEREERIQALLKERDRLKSEQVRDEWHRAELRQLYDEARLATRRYELYNNGRRSDALHYAENLACLRGHEHNSLIQSKRVKIYRLELDFWSLKRIVEDDTAAVEVSDRIGEKELENVKGNEEQAEKLAALKEDRVKLQTEEAEDLKEQDRLRSLHLAAKAKYDPKAKCPDRQVLWQATHSTACDLEDHFCQMERRSQRLRQIELDMYILRVDMWDFDSVHRRKRKLADFNRECGRTLSNPDAGSGSA